MLYLNFYNNSPGGCYFIKVENLRFCMGKGCARGGAVREVAQTSIKYKAPLPLFYII